MLQLVIFGKRLDEIAEIVSNSNPLKLNVKKPVENSLNSQLAKANSTNIMLIDKKIHRFSITKTSKKKAIYRSFRKINN